MTIRKLDSFQSIEFFKLREPGNSSAISRPPGVYLQDTLIQGNSILSTLFIKAIDPGASILVEYLEDTTGALFNEELILADHGTLTAIPTQPSKILVTRIHNKPICRVTITGGNVEFGVYATVVGTTANDIDNALHKEGDSVEFGTDKGIPIVGVDDSNEWVFARFDATGALRISGIINADITNAANQGRITIVPINSSSWTQLPTVPLASRVSISMQNLTGFQVAINYSTPAGFVGKILEDRNEIARDIDDTVTIYAKASSSIITPTVDLIVEELANV